MSFIAQTNPDGSPSISAAFVNAVLTSALYHGDENPFKVYAAIAGGTFRGLMSDKNTFWPDYSVITLGSTAMVVLDGTTNSAQWVAHCASAFCPSFDPLVGQAVVYSFYTGFGIVRDAIFDLVQPQTKTQIILTGHSYGAAAANICAQQLLWGPAPLAQIDIMTFGEPKSYSAVPLTRVPRSHNRLIACGSTALDISQADEEIDPVSLVPPNVMIFSKLGAKFTFAKFFLHLSWGHSGMPWYLSLTQLQQPETITGQSTPFVDELSLVDNIPNALLHLMDSSYLDKALNQWQLSGLNPELRPLVSYATNYLKLPFVPAVTTGPPIPATAINQSFSLPSGTVTEANRADFATITASASLEPRSTMPLAPIISPSLKGTIFYDMGLQGSSMSFYSIAGAGSPITFSAMMTKMQTIAQARSKLSQCVDTPACQNPFVFQALRVDDTTTKRKTLVNTNPNVTTQSCYPGPPSQYIIGQTALQNDEYDAAYKVQFNDGFGNTANLYFHGVPLKSELGPVVGGVQVVPAGFGGRFPTIDSQWLTNLYAFNNQLIALGLGLRYTTIQWTPMGAPVGVPPNQVLATGNGTPQAFPNLTPPVPAVQYNMAGTPINTYTFALNTPVLPFLGKFRVILREFKSLNVINGRWPAYGFIQNGVYYVNVRRRAAQYAWDGVGYLSPEIFSVLIPAPAGTAAGGNIPGVTAIELTSKKMGKSFGLQRGRAHSRPV